MERVIFNQQNYIKEDESYHIDSLAIKKNKHRKKTVHFLYKTFMCLQIQIKLNLQLKIIFSRTFTNNQKNNNKSIYFENRKTTTQ